MAQILAIMLAAAVSYGILYQKVESARSDISDIKKQMSVMNLKLDELSANSHSSLSTR